MSVRRVYIRFTDALKRRNFILDSNVATSPDKKVEVSFAGDVWVLKVAGKFVLEHPMVAGSFAALERALKTYDIVLSPSKKVTAKNNLISPIGAR